MKREKYIAPRLPEELIVEVLLRLPIKFLIQLRCVYKLFHRLISLDGWFARSYNLHISSNNKRDIILNNFTYLDEFDSIHEGKQHRVDAGKLVTKELAGVLGDSDACRFIFPDNHSFGLVGCCDGILCFHQWQKNVIYLCNPGLNQSRVVPLISGFTKLCFIPDPQTNDYKVIVILIRSYSFKISIYSLRRHCWTQIIRSPQVGKWESSRDNPVVVHNGNPHWIYVRKDSHSGEQVDAVVNFLDVTQETNAQIQLPEDCKRPPFWNDSLNLERYKGCLAVTYECLQEQGLHDFWVMGDDSKCWVKQVVWVGLPRPMLDHYGFPRARLCRQPCATTSWTYIINNFYPDGTAAILTDREDGNSAQKCNGGKDTCHFFSYIVAEYVSSFVSLLPEPRH